jgi:DNA-binding winged helix-turn-helix (wHTH) protein
MPSVSSSEPLGATCCYRFAGVEIDAGNLVLRIDGKVRSCPRKAFELLLALCRSPARVIGRDELIALLWPGGQVISDEALTQVIFRARALLGPYGKLIRTVRGRGLRLDALVLALDPVVPGPVPAARAALTEEWEEPGRAPTLDAAPRSEERTPLQYQRTLVLLAIVLLAALAYGAWRWAPAPEPVVIDAGYGLMLNDLYAGQPETADMVAGALLNESSGERSRAVALLQAVHASDARTPVPALFLALWAAGSGASETAEGWLAQAHSRIGSLRDVYINLLADYIAAEVHDSPQRVIQNAGALLDVRPDAWRMRHARAHLMEFSGMREAALREIAQITVPAFGDRKRDLAIADRASLGDVRGAQAILDRLSPDSDPATHAFLSGRVAWSRGDFEAAHAHFRAAAEYAFKVARLDLYRRSLVYWGAIEAMLGRDDEAVATLERARRALEDGMVVDDIDLTLFLAQLHAEAGRPDLMETELDRALAASPPTRSDNIAVVSRMAAWRLRPSKPPLPPAELSPETAALWQAMEAHSQGRTELARAALAEAWFNGIGHGRLADEARWLQLQLGLPVSPEMPIDPPHPPLSRVVLRRQIRAALAEGGVTAGPLRT